MPSFPERLPVSSSFEARAEPSLPAASGRASARLLRPRREPSPRSAEPAADALPCLSIGPGDRMVVSSDFAAAGAAGSARDNLRRQAMTGLVVALALFGAFSLGRLLLQLLPPGGFHLG